MDKLTCTTFAISDWLLPYLAAPRPWSCATPLAFSGSFNAFVQTCLSTRLHFSGSDDSLLLLRTMLYHYNVKLALCISATQ